MNDYTVYLDRWFFLQVRENILLDLVTGVCSQAYSNDKSMLIQ